MEALQILGTIVTIALLIFIAVRQESNTTTINNATSKIPQETDTSEFQEVINNLRDAFKKSGKKQSSLVHPTWGFDEVVITVRPSSKKIKPVIEDSVS